MEFFQSYLGHSFDHLFQSLFFEGKNGTGSISHPCCLGKTVQLCALVDVSLELLADKSFVLVENGPACMRDHCVNDSEEGIGAEVASQRRNSYAVVAAC